MRRLLPLLGLLAACALLSVDDASVAGIWGGAGTELETWPDSVHLLWGCNASSFTGGARLDRDGKFLVEGTITAVAGEGSTPHPPYGLLGRRMRIWGIQQRDTIQLATQYANSDGQWPQEQSDYVLTHGVHRTINFLCPV